MNAHFLGSERRLSAPFRAHQPAGLLSLVSLILSVAFVAPSQAQNYLTSTGAPPFSAPEPVEYGFTDMSTGNLHIEIPLGSYPQRGTDQPLTVRYVYDSNKLWSTAVVGTAWTWTPDPKAGWNQGQLSGQLSTLTDSNCNWAFVWTEPGGTQHTFPPIPLYYLCTSAPLQTSAYAADSSGYRIFATYTQGPGGTGSESYSVYAPDGTMVLNNGGNGYASSTTDSNGNYISLNGQGTYVDTLGRALPSTSLPNSQGGASNYTFASSTITVSTAFAQSGIAECNPSVNPNCTMRVVQSITLPDLTTFGFKYDCKASSGNAACGSPDGQSAYYGTLISMTLPTGGQVNYTWQAIQDSYSNKHLFVTSKNSASGWWYYSYAALSTCTQTQVGCQQQGTVTKPSGDRTVYTFTLNSGAWPVSVQYTGSSGLPSTVSTTWDFSIACPWTNCHGAAYVRKLSDTITIPLSSGSITKKTAYSYTSYITGLISVVKEWGFYAGVSPNFPSVPDRATYISYLNTGTNNINRPTKVTICNNSGTDSDCAGSGTRVAQTLTTYDSYGTGGISLVSGASNHDDTAFGTSNTARGNPTSIQQWVSGSTYLTTSKTYDTTGQAISVKDPGGNTTLYGYADNFFNDAGNTSTPVSPPSFTPQKQTNAYLTSITFPGISNAEKHGYYYGTGQQALETDVNLQSSYAHYFDPFSRVTENIFPIGWNWNTYSGATQIDGYAAIADTSASANCVSCTHNQNLYDSWGRNTSKTLVNAPEGPIEVDTTYDTNGRVQAQTHPHIGVADPNNVSETFSYDGFDRTLAEIHPDNQSSRTRYGADVTSFGGLASQQGSPSTYGYAQPVLLLDETGRTRQEWVDAFGRIVEVDEPAPAPSGKSMGTVTFSGTEQSTISPPYVCGPNGQTCTYTIYDGGTFAVTCGISKNVNWGGGSTTPASIATDVANAFNSDGSSPCTASASGNVVTFLSSTNQTFAASTNWNSQYFSQPSFAAATSGPSLTTGTGSLTYSVLITNYTYGVTGNLLQVIQGSQTRSYAYDHAGRRTSITTPEAGTDTLTYDSDTSCPTPNSFPGNLVKKMDARGVRTCYQYDSLNRLTQKNYSDGTATVTYTYDQGGAAAFALGRLTTMTDGSGSESYTYDKAGRVTQLSKVIGTQTFTTSLVLNAAGEPTTITYPSGRVVKQSYDNVGRLCEVAPTTSGCGTATSPFVTAVQYVPSGAVKAFNYGNGVAASYTYSPTTLQLTNLSYKKGATTLFGLNYWFQNDATNCPAGVPLNNGQINCITDVVDSGRNVSYTYDSLLRIISAVTNGSTSYPKWGVSWNYDRYGNRTAQSVTAGSAPSSSLVVDVTTNRPTGYTFDSSGNLTVEPVGSTNNNYAYDGEARMKTVSGGAGAAYTYDGKSLRVKKSLTGGTTTVYVFASGKDIAEYDNGAAVTSPTREYIYANSELISTITASSTVYHHHDHLSVRVTTDLNGNVVGQQGHFPYGETWYSQTNTTKFIFTTYEHDFETGLDYALARYYDSRMGRFCSPDPEEGWPDNPQSWNRYAYVGNDPVNITDPTGRNWLESLLMDIGIVLAEWFSGGSATPALAALETASNSDQLLLSIFMGIDNGMQQLGDQPMNAQQPKQQQSNTNTQGRVTCPPVNVNFTVVGPLPQAPSTSSLNHEKPGLGDVAIDPRSYGPNFSDYYKLGKQINPAKGHPNSPRFPNSRWALNKRTQEQVDLNNADITITPQSDASKLPDSGPYSGTDTISPAPKKPNSIDVYRADTRADANKGTGQGTVVITYNPGNHVQCPH